MLVFVAASLLWSGCRCDAPSPSREAGGDDANTTEQAAEREVPVTDLDVPDAPTLIITNGIRGYTEPCGCSKSLTLGGIDRLTHVAMHRAVESDSVLVDNGDLFFQQPDIRTEVRNQEVARAEVIADAARRMGIRLTVPGESDFAAGIETYKRLLARSGVEVLSTNASAHLRQQIDARTFANLSIGDRELTLLAVTDPKAMPTDQRELFEPMDTTLIETMDAVDITSEDTVVLLFQGDSREAQNLVRSVPTELLDFVVIGKHTTKGDSVADLAGVYGLEIYDQAREVGALRLFDGTPPGDNATTWEHLSAVDESELDALDGQIERLDSQISTLVERLEGRESPLLERLRSRRNDYQKQRRQLEARMGASPVVPPGGRFFYWHTTPLVPELPRDEIIEARRESFNRSLREMNLANAPPPPAAGPGEPTYVGADRCMTCHAPAHEFWETTAHGTAIDTLIEREKRYDTSCIGCHVTGYQQPGGSSLGHLYGLLNVQCESCHGPGSAHAAAPTSTPAAVNVVLEAEESTCTGCHNEEHSPSFEFERYRNLTLGPGHGE